MLKIQQTIAVIPALNEGPRIGHIVRTLKTHPQIKQVIVGNNGSTDNTKEEATSAGALVADEPQRGYGAACQAAIALIEEPCDSVLFINADGAENLNEVNHLLNTLSSADLVVGSRVLGHAEKGALLPQQRFGNWLACKLISFFWGKRFTDLGPFRAIRWSLLQALSLRDKNFGWIIEMQLKALQKKAVITELPVTTAKSEAPSKIAGTLSGSIFAAYKILSAIFHYGLLDRINALTYSKRKFFSRFYLACQPLSNEERKR